MKVDKMSLLPSLSSIRSGWASLFPSFAFHLPSLPSLLKGGWQRHKMVASKCAFHVAAVVGVTGQAEASAISSVWLLLWTTWMVAMEDQGRTDETTAAINKSSLISVQEMGWPSLTENSFLINFKLSVWLVYTQMHTIQLPLLDLVLCASKSFPENNKWCFHQDATRVFSECPITMSYFTNILKPSETNVLFWGSSHKCKSWRIRPRTWDN